MSRRLPGLDTERLAENPRESLRELADLLNPDESLWVLGEMHEGEGLTAFDEMTILQMEYAGPPMELEVRGGEIVRLGREDGPAMVALTDIAFPGFFRAKTYLMGTYYGIRVEGQLVAMAGERLAPTGYREISAVCTHPRTRVKVMRGT